MANHSLDYRIDKGSSIGANRSIQQSKAVAAPILAAETKRSSCIAQ